jgi:hypothetical protein
MPLEVIHKLHESVDVRYGKVPNHRDDGLLFRFIYEPHTREDESPKPYFHPLQTLSGNLVSIFRPHDHVWHAGLQMTMAQLSGQNFWGGPTYVRDKGYVQLPINGRIRHLGWQAIDCTSNVFLDERLAWITSEQETIIEERRTMKVDDLDVGVGYWSLDCSFALQNVTGRALRFGSPTTEGRPLAGYGGLFWRGPRSFAGGMVLAPEIEGPDCMGKASPWLAYVGRHDGSGDTSTLLFIDHPENPRYPTKWFVRNDPYAVVSYAFAFDEELVLTSAQTLSLRYRTVIIDGIWSRERIAAYAAAAPSGSGWSSPTAPAPS